MAVDGERDWTARAMDVVARLTGRGGRRSASVERVLLVLAVIVFVGAAVVAWQQLPELEESADLRWIALVALFGAAALAINAREFAWSARVLGSPVDGREALRVSTLSSAANVLPIPGSVAIRTRALLQGGQTLGTAAVVTTAVGIAWVAFAALAAAVLGAVLAEWGLAMITAASGVAGVVVAVLLLRRSAPAVTGRDFTELAVIEAASVLASGVRLYAVALTFGFGVSFGQAVTVNLGGILSNVAGLLPGGLGLREVASGAFGLLVGVPVSIGVLMAAADRIGFYLVLAVVALAMVRGGPGKIAHLSDEEAVDEVLGHGERHADEEHTGEEEA